MSQRPERIPPTRYARERRRATSERVPTPLPAHNDLEEFGHDVLEGFDFDAFIQVDDTSDVPDLRPINLWNSSITSWPTNSESTQQEPVNYQTDESDESAIPTFGLAEAIAFSDRNTTEYNRLSLPERSVSATDTILHSFWHGASPPISTVHPRMRFPRPPGAPPPRRVSPDWVYDYEQSLAALVLDRRGSLKRIGEGDQAERDLDTRLVQWMDPVCDWFAYSFGFRYCSDDYMTGYETPVESSEDEQEPGLRRKLLTRGANKRKPLPLLFMPSRGHLSRRLDKIRWPFSGRNPFPVPATETIVLESATLSFFRTDEIKLALWPDVQPGSQAHCAIFLVAEDSPIVESTKSYQVTYDTPVCNDDDSDSASEGGDEYVCYFHHKAIRPKEFNDTIPECDPIVTRAPKMKIKYSSRERGIVGTFARTSPFCYNVRVPREDSHLQPKFTEEQVHAHEAESSEDDEGSSDSVDSSSESDQENTEGPRQPAGPEPTVPLLTPHAVVELDGFVTTIKFPYAVATKSIILKFWLPTRRFDDVVLRKLEVFGSDGNRLFKVATRLC